MFKSKEKGEYIKYLLGIVAFVFGVLPYLIIVWYVVPVADDFTCATDITKSGGNSLSGIINMVKSGYSNWQGTFFAIALEGGIDPIHRGGFIRINVALFIIILFSVFTVVILINKLCINKFNKNVLYIIAVFVVLEIFEARITKELFFWYVGACAYAVPFVVGCLGSICMLRMFEVNDSKKKFKYLVITSLLGVLASGGTLQNAGYFCWIYLLFLGYNLFYKNKLLYSFIPFVCAVSGALINVMAPGNYVRKSISNFESISVFKAVEYTFIAVEKEVYYLFSQTYIPPMLLLIAILSVLFIKPSKKVIWNPIVVSVTMVASWIISTFPFCYGYASDRLEERNATVLDWFIIIGLFLMIISVANCCKLNAMVISQGTLFALVLLVTMNVGYLQNIIPISEIPSIRIWREILSGEAAEYHDEWIAVFETIEASDEAVVEVWISDEANRKDKVIKHPGMSDNFENWVNLGIAEFYGKEKVRVITTETYEED